MRRTSSVEFVVLALARRKPFVLLVQYYSYFLLCLNSILRLLMFTTSQLPTRLHYNT